MLILCLTEFNPSICLVLVNLRASFEVAENVRIVNFAEKLKFFSPRRQGRIEKEREHFPGEPRKNSPR